MKYAYVYKSSDGQRHEAAMEAPSREAVFAALRERGIKAIKVVALDGSKANGEVVVRGVRKRIVALVVVGLLLASALAILFAFRVGETAQEYKHQASSTSAPRHQLYGDPVIVGAIEHGKTEAWLTNRVDQLLAWFAQPGKIMCPRGTDPRLMAPVFASALLAAKSGTAELPLDVQEPREVRELKQMVNGMHEELREYLANGNGTPRSYWRRLIDRTRQEAQIYERTRRELENQTDPAAFEQRNESLRALGLRTIPNPKDTD